MNITSIIVIASALITAIIIVCYNLRIMYMCNENVFPGSGNPTKMAQTVVASIYATSQFVFGVIIVGILVVLIIEKVITSDAGMPIVSAVIGYLLGKTLKGDGGDGEDKTHSLLGSQAKNQ